MPLESFFITKLTLELQRLQTPSNNINFLCFGRSIFTQQKYRFLADYKRFIR